MVSPHLWLEDLAQKPRERRELTQDEWHGKDGYKEDIHSGFCSSALQKGNYTVSHQTYPAFCPPPKQRRSSSNSSPAGGISPPTRCLTRPSATTGASSVAVAQSRETKWILMGTCSLRPPGPRPDPIRPPAATFWKTKHTNEKPNRTTTKPPTYREVSPLPYFPSLFPVLTKSSLSLSLSLTDYPLQNCPSP